MYKMQIVLCTHIFFNCVYMLCVFKWAEILALTQILRKTYGKYPQVNTTYDSSQYYKLIVFYCYFRDDLTEFTQGLLFSSFHEHVPFLLL